MALKKTVETPTEVSTEDELVKYIPNAYKLAMEWVGYDVDDLSDKIKSEITTLKMQAGRKATKNNNENIKRTDNLIAFNIIAYAKKNGDITDTQFEDIQAKISTGESVPAEPELIVETSAADVPVVTAEPVKEVKKKGINWGKVILGGAIGVGLALLGINVAPNFFNKK